MCAKRSGSASTKYVPSLDLESSQRSESSEAKKEDSSESVEASVVKRHSPTCKLTGVLEVGAVKDWDIAKTMLLLSSVLELEILGNWRHLIKVPGNLRRGLDPTASTSCLRRA